LSTKNTGAVGRRRRPPGPRRSPLAALLPGVGDSPRGERLARLERSPNFADGAFRNPVPTRTGVSGPWWRLARTYLSRADRIRRSPARAIPVHRSTLADLAAPPRSGLRLTWMGHSTVLTEIDERRVLFDPVWGERCSPLTFLGPKRLHAVPVPMDALGEVDVIVISHDHYDHLDMPTIRALAGTRAPFVVPLGVGAHLERWGVPAARVTELDWHEATEIAGLTLTATPARHFCGRTIFNRQHSLWASWVVAGPEHRVYHSGDTGYFPGFSRIGAEHGPFDATMIQIGAYSEFWADIHMTPHEGVQAHGELRGRVMLPIHWGTFDLAPHPWEEPAEGAVAAAHAAGARIAVPRPGEPFEPEVGLALDPWWRAIAAGAAGRTWPALAGEGHATDPAQT